MGLFDKVRQVLARVEKVLPGTGRASDEPRGQKTGREATQQRPPAPVTAQPAHEPTAVAQTSAPASSPVQERATSEAPDVPDAPEAAATPHTAAADTPAAEPRRYRTHTLLPGQSLADVAEQHGVSVEDVAELNGVDPELVFAGQVFRIPHA
ncbi:LysM peptidoglycan-binding domain-containing protein [Ornithinimicrobium sufpigmenti]|uniref:LysM peptidoglycan-binding domain-containing protein n=1 Tax=Ornithinimicrobium sufpigmenti TaxID=2508882 RepID=UPI001036662E|nr:MULTISPECIES: LysM peptidoglycan-binding domain-containing protein [unclassified Ornithinimicrobium]